MRFCVFAFNRGGCCSRCWARGVKVRVMGLFVVVLVSTVFVRVSVTIFIGFSPVVPLRFEIERFQ